MNAPPTLPQGSVDPKLDGIIKLAVMAVGGQGGGVLTGWIETLARSQGFACQATSVAGVAQRTGATIYYVEMAAEGHAQPVFALAPSAGDVDVLIAAELMEAGRAIMRGFVTPDRTTLIASTHRALAVSEKMQPGDGIADASEVLAAAEVAAERLVSADMEALAVANGSVISATLFGALAASGRLPFPTEAFEAAIRAGGKGVEASLRAFRAGHAAALAPAPPEPAGEATPPEPPHVSGPAHLLRQWSRLEAQINGLPDAARTMTRAGLRKVVAFMDVSYGQEYLDRVTALAALDEAGQGYALTTAAAKHIANAMAYDDVIRVAELKTRATRADRIAADMRASDDQILQVTEFLHPRAEELVGLLPARIGRRVEANPRWMARIDRWFARGRRLRSDRLGGFLVLHALGGLTRYRRRTHRHAVEAAHLARWLQHATEALPGDYALAVEILRCRRLIKGYSDTHARGLTKFDKVLGALPTIQAQPDAADRLRRLREAALEDEDGTSLDRALAAEADAAAEK